MKPITRVIEQARRNGGVITLAEAIALGMSRTTIQRRVKEGILVRPRPGVIALPGPFDQHLLDLRAACRKLGAVVSHESAGYLLELDRYNYAPPTVSVPRNQTKDLPGVVVHQVTDLTEGQLTIKEGLNVTNPARTIIDLAAKISDRRLDRILDHALASGNLSLEELSRLFSQLGRRGKPGTARMRRLLESRTDQSAPPESVLERMLLDVIAEAHLPSPVIQFQAPWLRRVNGRVDLAYPEQRLLIEADGRRWHTLQAAFESDRHRDNAAQLAGWRVLRFTWEALRERPGVVARTIQSALEDERI